MRAKLVGEFRSTVDLIIGQQVEACDARKRSWPNYDKYAETPSLGFGSFNKTDSRPSLFGLGSEHLWGVHTRTLRCDAISMSGLLAVTSELEDPELLTRRWAFATSMSGLKVATQRPLDIHEIGEVLDWLELPHLNPHVLENIGELSEREVTDVTVKRDEINAASRKRQEDLNLLANARSRDVAVAGSNIVL